MANEDISDLQAVDYRLGKVLIDAYKDLALTGPVEYQRFIKRVQTDPKTAIGIAKNDDIQAVLKKIARHDDEPEVGGPDLPLIVYYREQGLSADMNQHPQVIGVTRFDDQDTIYDKDKAMTVTYIPVTLTYSILFLAWDRATIDRMALAWWAYILPLERKHSGFDVQYNFNGDIVDVHCSMNTPRDILTSSEDMGGTEDNPLRLWGSRTMCEINTQAIYGAKVKLQDYFRIIFDWDVML